MMSLSVQEGQRKRHEAEFHNNRERDRLQLTEAEFCRKYSNKQNYVISRKSRSFCERWLRKHCPGKTVLDYCCGLGQVSVQMAGYGAFVHGIDISAESIAAARQAASIAGLSGRVDFSVMDAESLRFENAKFDIIMCSGVLHHLDVKQAFPELARVLKPDGKVLCVEPLGYNPAVALYRKLTPHLRTEWESNHILKRRDLAIAGNSFRTVDVRYFHLFSLLALPFRGTPVFEPVLKVMDSIDSLSMRIPLLQLMAWQMVFVLASPKAQE